MIKSTQKIIKIGSSSGITIPAKDLKHAGLKVGDTVEITAKPIKESLSLADAEVFAAAKKVLNQHRSDFDNLAKR